MRILSATEAISPAIARTKLILFKPFRLGRSWKFSATAYVSTMGTFFFPLPLLGLFAIPVAFRDAPHWAVWAIFGGILLLLVITVFLFILCSRLQFPFMDIVMNRSAFVAPLWRQYGPQARRWTQAKVVIGTIAMLVLTVPLAPFIWFWLRNINNIPTANHPHPLAFPFAFFGIFFLVYAVIILIALALSLLNDFMLPPLALEDVSIHDSWQWVVALVRAEPGQVALYALLKIVLGFVAQMACVIVFEIIFFIVMMVIGLLSAVLAGLLHAMHVPDLIFQIITFTLLFGFEFAFIGYFSPFSYGIPLVFLEAYKLYFLGGRYPPLGEILDRTTPPSQPLPPAPQYGYVPIQPVPPANLS